MNNKSFKMFFISCVMLVFVLTFGINAYAEDTSGDSDQTEDVPASEPVGWKQENNNWYYLDENGTAVTGWLDLEGKIYYLDESGIRQSGWKTIKSSKFYFQNDGIMKTGWLKIKNKKYYLSSTGALGIKGKMLKGWQGIGSNRYYFSSKGVLNTSKKKKIKKIQYYFKSDGRQRTGWIKAEKGFRKYYYKKIDNSKKWGQMVKGKTFKGYYFNKKGLTNKSFKYCKKVLDKNGWNLRAAYNWSAGLSYSGRTVYLANWGSEKLALQGFRHHTGNCYVMAAVYYELAKCMGYDAHQIAGAVPSRRGGLTNHSWVEIEHKNGLWVYDPNITMETGKDLFHFKYKTPGTMVYSNYRRMN